MTLTKEISLANTANANAVERARLSTPMLVGDHQNVFTGSLDRLRGGVLLVVGAHPDDETTSHGMQEYLSRELKMKRYAVIGTNGEAGQDFRSPNRIAASEYMGMQRREESRSALDLLGYHGAFYLNLPDGGIQYNLQTILDLRQIILGLRPAAMIRTSTDPREDSDHIIMSLMAEKAKWLSATSAIGGEEIPHYIPIDLESEMMHLSVVRYPLVIDTSHYNDRKIEHWKRHKSQFPNPHINAHFPQLSQTRARIVGQGSQDAEAYGLRDGIDQFSIEGDEFNIFKSGFSRYQPGYVYEQGVGSDRQLVMHSLHT